MSGQSVWRAVGRRIRRRGDEGVALVVVVGSMLVLAMLAMIALAYTVNSQQFAKYDQNYGGAVAAAQSGVEDFLSRLNRDDTYGAVWDCTNGAWKGPTTKPNPCGWSSATPVGWLPVSSGASSPDAPHFHYSVDASLKLQQGTIMLTVTGRADGVMRTLEVAVGKGGSTDYVYYTDFESADPSNVQAYPSTAGWTTAKRNACGINGYDSALYWWETDGAGRNRDYYDCMEITFIANDTLDGAVFTNDTILSSGATFKKGVETGNPGCAAAGASTSSWNTACLRSGSTANFNGIKPRTAQPKYLDDNSAAFATNPGCHYFGSTRVVFSENGRMRVWNKKVVNNNTAPVSIAPAGGMAPACGTLDDLNSAVGADLAVPDNLVIYTAASTAAKRQCYAGELGGSGTSQLPVGTYTSTHVAAPTGAGQSYTYDTNMTETPKMCAEGNLYAEGVLKGRVTLAAAQSVIVTGDLVLAGGLNGSDMLGLVATNSVEVFHPRQVTVTSTKVTPTCTVSCAYKWGTPSAEAEVSGWPKRYKEPAAAGYTPSSGIQIAGSIQTLQHSFLVQKYSVGGNAGTLLVNGSIAQRWRGIVGQGSGASMNGYAKLYQYDTRLQYARPPYFPTWANSQWSSRFVGEIANPQPVKG